MPSVHLFGVRHHGPGCARSLAKAFDALAPDCVLIEGPPECDELLWAVTAEGMEPPVALLGYCPDEPRLAVYYPFAQFSPEWQALRWAQLRQVPARFIDLPLVHKLALEKERAEAWQASQPAGEEGGTGDGRPQPEEVTEQQPAANDAARQDPLNWFAQAAGYADGEAWWNHMVEERGDGEQLFAAIAEAMTALRQDWEERFKEQDPFRARREALREAHMRQSLRAARKDGFERIAVVCGAWHLLTLAPLVETDTPAKADSALLKGLPKMKVHCTWIPWTYRHLTYESGYGAGILSPGWYEHLWRSGGDRNARAVGWLTRVAGLMRGRDLDCSSASLIEATRLSETLAALRELPAPGLHELQEATLAVLTSGDDSVLRFISDELIVGDRLGQVPSTVPTVPLQRDLEAQQKSLRLKPEAAQKTLDFDLRNETDLARSHLLHRLNLLRVPWGDVKTVAKSSRGTFHEVWSLQWKPEFVMPLIEASRWGQTVEQAAVAVAVDQANNAKDLAALAALVDRVLLASLERAAAPVIDRLQDRAATTLDALQLMRALPALANAYRYGTVRRIDADLLAHVLDGLITRAAISLPLACVALDEQAAAKMRDVLLAANSAVRLRNDAAQTDAWQQALDAVAGMGNANALVQGLCARLLVDDGAWTMDAAGTALSLHLSAGSKPAQAAAWLEGFLNQNASVMLHDDAFWSLIDHWLACLNDEHFMSVLPLIRRTFSTFSAGERRQLGERAVRGRATVVATASEAGWDEAAAAKALVLVRQIFGVGT